MNSYKKTVNKINYKTVAFFAFSSVAAFFIHRKIKSYWDENFSVKEGQHSFNREEMDYLINTTEDLKQRVELLEKFIIALQDQMIDIQTKLNDYQSLTQRFEYDHPIYGTTRPEELLLEDARARITPPSLSLEEEREVDSSGDDEKQNQSQNFVPTEPSAPSSP